MDAAESVRILQSALPDLRAVYRFGSTVSGDIHGGSDVDLAVVKNIIARHLPDFLAFATAAIRLAGEG